MAEMPKKRAAYTRNSKSTKYRKVGPSGSLTKAAHSTLSITNFFSIDNDNGNNCTYDHINIDKNNDVGKGDNDDYDDGNDGNGSGFNDV